MTPEGWARATVLFQTLREPPAPGSPQESVLILYCLRREQVEHERLRALAQTLISKEKGIEAFDAYRKVAFPWIEAEERRAQDKSVDALKNEIARGGLAVQPLWRGPVRSRLKSRVAGGAPRRGDA